MDTLQLWSQIGNYRILAPIAHGGFGSTYKGQHSTLLNRIVAIKLVQNTFLTTQKDRDRLLYEAYLLEHLRHPYIVALIDAGIHEGRPYLVMEYMSHGTLQDCLDQHGTRPLSQEKTMEILTRIGQALTYAHRMGIVHRDLKPANILFNIKNEAFLADFGIAAILNNATMRKTTTILGSLRFMAPEQFKGIISKEGDQYALACIAYQLFTGHAPFEMSDPATLMYHHLNEYPLTPRHFNIHLPTHIERALFKGMAKQRSERYPSIAEFLMALQPSSYWPSSTNGTKYNDKKFSFCSFSSRLALQAGRTRKTEKTQQH